MADLAVYFGLFLVARLAATIFPAQSEALVAGLLLTGWQQKLNKAGVYPLGPMRPHLHVHYRNSSHRHLLDMINESRA